VKSPLCSRKSASLTIQWFKRENIGSGIVTAFQMCVFFCWQFWLLSKLLLSIQSVVCSVWMRLCPTFLPGNISQPFEISHEKNHPARTFLFPHLQTFSCSHNAKWSDANATEPDSGSTENESRIENWIEIGLSLSCLPPGTLVLTHGWGLTDLQGA